MNLVLLPPVFVSPDIVLNVLSQQAVVTHLWQEFHAKASTSTYGGPATDDRRVVENPDTNGSLRAKTSLHLCFLEKAVATIQANVPSGATYYARWQILDDAGAVVREHAKMSAANFDANNANARLQTGKHGWLWDGRNSANKPVFVAAGTYKSRVTVKDGAGNQVHESEAQIAVEGDPYRVFIVGTPKSDAELAMEMGKASYNGRYLDTTGERSARDSWIVVYRGARQEDHAVFLGHGALEATMASDNANRGAIATPHGREYKGFVRKDPHSVVLNTDRVQFEDLGNSSGQMALSNPGGPVPMNPYAGSAGSSYPYKDGVQAHAGKATWTSNGMSVGCTTVSPTQGATVAQPGAVFGALRSLDSSFGDFGDAASENVSVQGPDFDNKQTKRSRTADALLADTHASPLLDPPQNPPPSGATAPADEPLHMQPTLQKGAFGGFKGHEIPLTLATPDSPADKLRIRMELESYNVASRYQQYHHAVVFGHTVQSVGNGYEITVWIPRKIIRGWNGNFRNLLVRGKTEISWYIDHIPLAPGPIAGWQDGLHPTGAQTGSFVALPNGFVGRTRRTWTPPPGPIPLEPGRYVSTFRYRVQLLPFAAGSDAWVAEAAAADAWSTAAQLAGEQIVINGSQAFLEGTSTLTVHTVT